MYAGIEGTWKLKRICEGTDTFVLHNLFDFFWHSPTTEIAKISEGEYSWHTAVLNSFSTTLSTKNFQFNFKRENSCGGR